MHHHHKFLNEQEAHATIALFQSLLSSDTHYDDDDDDKSDVKVYSDVASRFSEWVKDVPDVKSMIFQFVTEKNFYRSKKMISENISGTPGGSPFPAEVR